MKTTQIEYLNNKLIITGNYEEEESQVMYDSDMAGYEGYPATFEILKIETESGDDITDLIWHESDLEAIELLCLDNLDNE